MTSPPDPFWQELQPIWRDGALFARASVADRIVCREHLSVQLAVGESRPPFNFHQLWLGQQKHLHQMGLRVFDQVRADCDFGAWDCWDEQRGWLSNLFREFFPENEEAIGVCSVLASRRPAWCRTQQDPTISITQGVARPYYLRGVSQLGKAALTLGDRRIPTVGMRMAGMSERSFRKSKITMTVVPRRAKSTRHGLNSSYDEYWICLADPVDHADLLRQGRLPVAGEAFYHWGEGRIRVSPIVNLIAISRTLMYSVLAVELHPVSAEVLSIRWTRYPLSVAMLQASPIQHYAIQQALSQFR